jgi:hypothetical protein
MSPGPWLWCGRGGRRSGGRVCGVQELSIRSSRIPREEPTAEPARGIVDERDQHDLLVAAVLDPRVHRGVHQNHLFEGAAPLPPLSVPVPPRFRLPQPRLDHPEPQGRRIDPPRIAELPPPSSAAPPPPGRRPPAGLAPSGSMSAHPLSEYGVHPHGSERIPKEDISISARPDISTSTLQARAHNS